MSITKSISNIFKSNFVYLLTNEWYKTYQTGFSFHHLGHAPGVGLEGVQGVGGVNFFFFFEIQPNLLCELLTWMAHAMAQFFWYPPPGALGRGQKVKFNLISITKSISNIFKPNFVCLLTNERYKTYIVLSDGIFIQSPGSCPRGGTLGVLGG